MKSEELKKIKELILLLDILDETVQKGVMTDSNLEKEMKEVLERLKKFVADGVLKNLEEIEEIVIVVDTVNGFMKGGVMANPNAMHIVPSEIELIEKIISRNGLVIFLKEWHNANSVEFNSFLSHCLEYTWEAELIDELKPYEEFGITIEKNSTSFMFARGFINLMKLMKNLKLIVGCGVCGDICVPNGFVPLKNYFNQNNREVEIIIPKDSMDTFDSPNHNRDEYQHASNILMEQSGIKLVKKINDINWRKL